MKKCFFTACLLLLLISVTALGEAAVSPERAAYALGEAVRLTVTGDRAIKHCRYTVTLDDKVLFQQKSNDKHTDVYYLPRQPGTYRIDAAVTFADKKKETASCEFLVTELEALEAADSLYSQKDGSWDRVKYGSEQLEKSGCAIFTLSNALHALGHTGEETEPAALASRYGYCLIQGGTSNVRLITQASRDFDFVTQSALVKSEAGIRDLIRDGAVFTFSIVRGHLAFACELSGDGTKVRVIDSAPSATMERIKKSSLYRLDEAGNFTEVEDLSEFPEGKYYFETGQYGGLTYWLDLSYVAKRGVRIIQPGWLKVKTDSGEEDAELVAFGTVESAVQVNGETKILPTGSLIWKAETEMPAAVYVVSKKTALLLDSGGTQIDRVPRGALLPLIAQEEDRFCVRFEGRLGFLSLEDGEAVSIPPEEAKEGTVHINGTVSGKSNVGFRRSPLSNSTQIGYWPTGTKVWVLEEEDGFLLAEAEGKRGWILPKNVQME